MSLCSLLRRRRLLTAACLCVLLPAAGLGAASSASAATTAQLSSRVAAAVNSVRTGHHAPALSTTTALMRVADRHTALIVTRGALASRYAGEPSLSSALAAQGYHPAAGLVMVASSPNQDAVAKVPSAIVYGSSSSRWLLSAGFTQLGTSVRYSGTMHRYVMTIVLARPITTAALLAATVLSRLNSERAANGLPALRANVSLMSSAHSHNLAMARQDTMSHQLVGESAFTTRISLAGYQWRYAGENIGWSSAISISGALSLQVDMYNEQAPNDGHRQNILSRNYTDVGVDVYVDNIHHKLWLTEDFGRR